jgi:hypothetical protein
MKVQLNHLITRKSGMSNQGELIEIDFPALGFLWWFAPK